MFDRFLNTSLITITELNTPECLYTSKIWCSVHPTFIALIYSTEFWHHLRRNVCRSYIKLIKRQSCYHIETSQLICRVNQLTGFYMMVTVVFNELIYFISFEKPVFKNGYINFHQTVSIINFCNVIDLKNQSFFRALNCFDFFGPTVETFSTNYQYQSSERFCT